MVTLNGSADSLSFAKDGSVHQAAQPFTAIPYFAWANRGRGEMAVWLADDVRHASPTMQPTLASGAKVTTSGGNSPFAINSPHEPKSSVDQSQFFHWWPKKGTTEWVEYAFSQPTRVHQADLYWFDDTGVGECRVPKSWRLLVWVDNAWKPVETEDTFGVKLNAYNSVQFSPISTTKMRLEVDLQGEWSGGIQQWRIK